MTDQGQRRGTLKSIAHAAWHGIGHGFPAALFLASALIVVAQAGWLSGLEPYFMRLAYAIQEKGPSWIGLRHVDRRYPQLKPTDLTRVLTISQQAYAEEFGRRSPVERGCLALALHRLSQSLAQRSRDLPKPIVAIDIDVTLELDEDLHSPPDGGARYEDGCIGRPELIATELTALKSNAVVIALALARASPGARGGRNRFIARVCDDQFEPGRGGLYFASAAAFSRGSAPIAQVPWKHRHWRDGATMRSHPSGALLPAHYPSLGTLMGLARQANDPDYQATDDAKRSLPAQRDALTAICREAKEDEPTQERRAWQTLEDVVFSGSGPDGPGEIGTDYSFRYLNFLAALAEVREERVDRTLDLTAVDPSPAVFIMAIDDGSTADRFVTVAVHDDFLPGAWLHAAAAASVKSDLADAGKAVKFAADLVAGLLFAALVSPMASLRAWRAPGLRFVRRASILALPVLAFVLVSLAGFWISALLLAYPLWFNPVYIALGMLLHTYFDAATEPPAAYYLARPKSTGSDSRWQRASQFLASTLSDWTDVAPTDAVPQRDSRDMVAWVAWAGIYVVTVLVGLTIVAAELWNLVRSWMT